MGPTELLLLRRIIVSYYHGGNEALKEKKNKFNLHFRNIIGNLLEIPEQKDTKMNKEKKRISGEYNRVRRCPNCHQNSHWLGQSCLCFQNQIPPILL